MGPKVLSYPCWTVRTILVRRKVAANSPFSKKSNWVAKIALDQNVNVRFGYEKDLVEVQRKL